MNWPDVLSSQLISIDFSIMKVVTLADALRIIESGDPFDMVWITADRQRNRGGGILEAKGAVMQSKRNSNSARQEAPGPQQPAPSTRNPNHYAHGTRNIRLASGKIRKVHIQLIDQINGMKVV